MENKQTALDILFEEIKESTAVMPNALFKYFEMVYDKSKQIEKEQMIEFAMHLHKIDDSKTGTDILMEEAEQYYNKTYGKI
jgi:hypothetical protein